MWFQTLFSALNKIHQNKIIFFKKVVISNGKVLYEDMVTALLFLLSLLCRYVSIDKPTLSHK